MLFKVDMLELISIAIIFAIFAIIIIAWLRKNGCQCQGRQYGGNV